MKRVHLICNAHLDPVWLWQWEDGAAEAISTFRVAADFCEEFNGFVFNHNEVILYKWIEEYEPELFRRIQRLVAEGKWHIMGGWYLQPDCNMPSGESFVRQILLGRSYFKEKFGVTPTTAVNMDPFGHTRGLVQILRKSGYDSYLFWRPTRNKFALPADDFTWIGYDGSKITGHRSYDSYRADMGHAHTKIQDWLKENEKADCGFVLWGVGNHGGGPSRIDLANIQQLIKETKDFEIVHSTPEAYVREIKNIKGEFPDFDRDLNPSFTGCYTSQIRVKQKHRELENSLYMAEKMLSHAALNGFLKYPSNELENIQCDLAFSEFHDILPGSSIQEVEEDALRLFDHGLEAASRLKAKAFFALASGQRKAEEGEIPIFIYNPHPYKVKGMFECEFNLPERNLELPKFTVPDIYKDGEKLLCQGEKPSCNVGNDWRKKAVFYAELEPGCLNRFDCRIRLIEKRPIPVRTEENGAISFKTEELEVTINTRTGLMDKYCVNGVDYLAEGSFKPVVMKDTIDSWGHEWISYREMEGSFALMTPEAGTAFSDICGDVVPSVRVVEDGEARTIIESVMSYKDSFMVLTYKLPKRGTEIGVDARVYWNEKTKFLKLSIPTLLKDANYLGQVAYGVEALPANGNEVVSQKWSGAFSEAENMAFTCINNGIYGSDFKDGEIRLSLLRSPGYSDDSYNKEAKLEYMRRHDLRMDQGERLFRFRFNAGKYGERFCAIDREALALNEKPFALSFYPSGSGKMPLPLAKLSDASIQMTAFKKAVDSESFIVRLYEPTGKARSTTLSVPAADVEKELELKPYEIKTLKIDLSDKTISEADLMENEI